MPNSRAKRTSLSHPYDVLFQMVIGTWISQPLGTAVEIGVPDQLARGERQCSDIAREAGVSEDGLYRLLRALASVGLFTERADRRFRLNKKFEAIGKTQPRNFIKASHKQPAAVQGVHVTTESLSTSSMSFPSQA